MAPDQSNESPGRYAQERGEASTGQEPFNRLKETGQTLGERRVRLTFNPSDNSLVNQLKSHAARFIDMVEEMKVPRDAPKADEINRLCALAQTDIEVAAMHAVKAATA